MEKNNHDDLGVKVSNLIDISSKTIDSGQVIRLGVGFGIRVDGDFPIIINPVKNIISLSNPEFYETASKLIDAYNLNNMDFVLKTNYNKPA